MIKYLGSKRRLVPVLARICAASGARTALDLFTGTTRVAQAFKAQGLFVTAIDSARYAHVFAQAYIAADAAAMGTDKNEIEILHFAVGRLCEAVRDLRAEYMADLQRVEAAAASS